MALQPHITAAYRGWNGLPTESLDLRAAFADPADLVFAKAEIVRIRAPRGHKTLADCDHESKIRCETLERMVREYETMASATI